MTFASDGRVPEGPVGDNSTRLGEAMTFAARSPLSLSARMIACWGCLVLVTSRQDFTLPGYRPLNLDQLREHDACELLLKIAPRIGDQAGLLAELCGYPYEL